ncbi:hypothetical protein DPMN_166359 [Dreissena polymorpha]|uniref:Uncharacterized protein n=1 Tax=Dreissena polymorpha TaxID=45954 RepID=A0A9D4IXB5_DREPO|nr:hypothetical protein DPMN_166359 [Dreissena polymorpha]
MNSSLALHINGTNLLTKFHEDPTIYVAATVLPRQIFMTHNGKRPPPPPGGHVYLPRQTIFELNCRIQETNVPNKFHQDWAKNVSSRLFICFFHYIHIEKTAPPPGGHVLSPMMIMKITPRRPCFLPIQTIFELNHRTNNVTSREYSNIFTLYISRKLPRALVAMFFHRSAPFFELVRDINKTNVLTKFHDDWAKMFLYSHIRNIAPPPGGHVFQGTGTILKFNQHIVYTNNLTKTNVLTKFHKYQTINVASGVFTRQTLTTDDLRRMTDKRRSQKLTMSTLCSGSTHCMRLTLGNVYYLALMTCNQTTTSQKIGLKVVDDDHILEQTGRQTDRQTKHIIQIYPRSFDPGSYKQRRKWRKVCSRRTTLSSGCAGTWKTSASRKAATNSPVTTEKVENAHRMLRELKEHRIEGRMHSDQIVLDNVHWVGREGMSEAQRLYLVSLCHDFVDNIISPVTKAIRNRKLLHDRLTEECLQHIRLCPAKCAEALLDDFTAVKAAFPGEPLIKCILEALLLSRKGLQTDPVQFVPQLLGRIEDNESLEEIKIWYIKVEPPRLLRKVALCHGDEWVVMEKNSKQRTGRSSSVVFVNSASLQVTLPPCRLQDVAYFHGIVHRSSRQEEDCLEHKSKLTDARTVDMVTVVTIASDNNLRVWDRSRDKKRTTDRQARKLAPIKYIE